MGYQWRYWLKPLYGEVETRRQTWDQNRLPRPPGVFLACLFLLTSVCLRACPPGVVHMLALGVSQQPGGGRSSTAGKFQGQILPWLRETLFPWEGTGSGPTSFPSRCCEGGGRGEAGGSWGKEEGGRRKVGLSSERAPCKGATQGPQSRAP